MFLLWIGLAALFVLIGWGVHIKKWYFLISGYNMMSKEEQAKVNVEPLAKSLAIMSYIIAVLLLLMGITIHFELWTLSMVVTGLMIVIPFYFVFKGQKYYNDSSASGTNKKTKKISLIITVVTLVFVAIILYFSMQPTKYKVSDSELSISGMYGGDYTWDSIESIQMLEELPAIGARTNGSAVGSKLKGNFKFKDGDSVVLFVDKSVPPFIRLEVDGKVIIFNDTTEQNTKALFEAIQKQINE